MYAAQNRRAPAGPHPRGVGGGVDGARRRRRLGCSSSSAARPPCGCSSATAPTSCIWRRHALINGVVHRARRGCSSCERCRASDRPSSRPSRASSNSSCASGRRSSSGALGFAGSCGRTPGMDRRGRHPHPGLRARAPRTGRMPVDPPEVTETTTIPVIGPTDGRWWWMPS
jgi:hypothetical protein